MIWSNWSILYQSLSVAPELDFFLQQAVVVDGRHSSLGLLLHHTWDEAWERERLSCCSMYIFHGRSKQKEHRKKLVFFSICGKDWASHRSVSSSISPWLLVSPSNQFLQSYTTVVKLLLFGLFSVVLGSCLSGWTNPHPDDAVVDVKNTDLGSLKSYRCLISYQVKWICDVPRFVKGHISTRRHLINVWLTGVREIGQVIPLVLLHLVDEGAPSRK